LRAVPTEEGVEAAIVINVGASDATYFRASDDVVESIRIPLQVGANRWKIADSGHWAVAWSGSDEPGLDPTDGRQEISLVDLRGEEPLSRRLSVGYRPESIHFDSAENTLIVVSRLGVSLIDLESEELTWVAVSESAGLEVLVTKEGAHALVRREGSPIVQIMALDQDASTVELELPGEVTDLDLVVGGRVVAVCRDASTVTTFKLEDVLNDPSMIDTVLIQGAAVGSAEVTQGGDRIVLYTNAFDSALITIVNLSAGDDYLAYRTLDTQTPVQYVRMSPDGRHAISVGTGAAGVTGSAFSVISLVELRFARVFGTQSPILQVALGDEYGVVTASMASGVHEVHLVSFEGLHVETLSLASAPLSVGLLPDLGVGFSAQSHAEGRITFFDLENASARTLTGFELSSEIVEQ
jgi:hypothetical protein